MTEIQKRIKKLNDEFNSLYDELVYKKEYDLALKLSGVYWAAQGANYTDGLEFMKNLYKL